MDFEDLVENQSEREMPKNVVWLAIESKHLNGISRFWTIVTIAIQSFVYFLIVLMYYYTGLLELKDGNKMTATLFENSDHISFWNMIFAKFNTSYQDRCDEAITQCNQSSAEEYDEDVCDCVCDVLNSPRNFILNIVMCIVLFFGIIFNTIGIYAKIQILRGHYFRYTNLILINQSMLYIVMPFLWWALSDPGGDSCRGEYGNFVWQMPIMGALLVICYIWGRYYSNKLDYSRTIQILLESDDSEEEYDDADTAEDGINVRMQDSDGRLIGETETLLTEEVLTSKMPTTSAHHSTTNENRSSNNDFLFERNSSALVITERLSINDDSQNKSGDAGGDKDD